MEVSFGGDVLAEGAVVVVYFIPSMAETTYSVSFLEGLGDFASDFLNDTAVIAANRGFQSAKGKGEGLDTTWLPRELGNSLWPLCSSKSQHASNPSDSKQQLWFDKNIIISKLGNGSFLDLNLARLLNNAGVILGHCERRFLDEGISRNFN